MNDIQDEAYTDNIDNLFDGIVDSLFSHVEKGLPSPEKDSIDKYIVKFSKNLKTEHLSNFKKEMIDVIFDILNKYAYAYVIVSLSSKIKDFSNFVLSFNKDATFNSIIIETNELVNKVYYLIDNEKHIVDGKIVLDETFSKPVQIFNGLNDMLKTLNKKESKHVLLKYILYTTYFVPHHKPDLFLKIELLELEMLETKMIEVVRSNDIQVDYNSIESLIGIGQRAMIDDIYSMMSGEEEDIEHIDNMTVNDKITMAFKNLSIVPIVDDFLRLDKSTETYESTNINPNVRVNKKNNTKIRYILEKMNAIMDYNKTKNESVFHKPKRTRNAVLINNMEELDIIKKLNCVHNKTDDQITQLDDLISLREYPYQKFRDAKPNSFPIEPSKTVHAIRYSNIEHKNKIPSHKPIEWRILNSRIGGDVVGIALTCNTTLQQNMHSLVDINTSNKSTILSVLSRAKRIILTDSGCNEKIYYWIFDKEKDFDKRFIDFDTVPHDEYYISVIEYLIDEMSKLTYDKVINVLNTVSERNVITLFAIANEIIFQSLPLTKEKQAELHKFIYNLSNTGVQLIEEEENISFDKELKALTKSTINYRSKRINEELEDFTEDGEMYNASQCQHNITWRNMVNLRLNNPNKYNDKLQEFIKEFVIENGDKEFVCKSCSQMIELKRYVADWTSTTEEGINLTLSLQTSLENIPEYEKYNVAIKNISKIIEKFAGATGMTQLTGSSLSVDIKRQGIVKHLVDIMSLQNEKLKVMNSEKSRRTRLENAIKLYGIMPNLSKFFLFELKNDIFTYSSKESDKFKKPKLNMIVSYVIMLMIIEVNNSVLRNLNNDKQMNYYVFDKIGYSMFSDLKIRFNMGNDITCLSNYKVLCYLLFILSGMAVKYNLWFGDSENKKTIANANNQKQIIHTLVDLINDILESNTNAVKYPYDNFSKRFFILLRTEFSGPKADETLEILQNSANKKITVGPNNKIMFRLNQSTEYPLKTYFDIKEPEFTKWTKYGRYVIRSYTHELKIEDFLSSKQLKEIQTSTVKPMIKQNNDLPNIKKVVPVVDRGDFYNAVEDIIKSWEDIVGKDSKINEQHLYLRNTVYYVDHDYRGQKVDDILIINSKDKILGFKKNDSHFKINVYLFHNKKNNVHMFYNASTYEYLGYKYGEKYVDITGTNNNLRPTFSVLNMLLFLGHTHRQYKLDETLQEIIESDINIENFKLHMFLSNIIKERIRNVKSILYYTQRVLNQITNKKRKMTEKIAIKFGKLFKNLTLTKGNISVFSDINDVTRSSLYKKIPKDIKIVFNKDYLYASDIIKLHNTDQQLLIYACGEFKKLLDINENQHTKIMLINLMSNIILDQYNTYMYRDISLTFSDVKRFVAMKSNLLLKSEGYSDDIFTDLTEEEKLQRQEEEYTEQEKNDAIDVDYEEDSEDEGGQLADTFRD